MASVRRSRTSSRNSLTIMALMPSTIRTLRRKSQQLVKLPRVGERARDLVIWWHDEFDTARRPVDAGRPVRVPLALPAGGGAARDGRVAGGAGVRAGRRNSARPGLLRPGRVPRLVRRRPRVVRHRPRRGHAGLPARRTGGRHLAGGDRRAPGASGRRGLPGDRDDELVTEPLTGSATAPARAAVPGGPAAAPGPAGPARPALGGPRPAPPPRAAR